jgi:hypothetical protein
MNINKFESLFTAMCERYGYKEPDVAVVKIYYGYLSQLTDEQWQRVFEWTIGTQKFLPTPVEMLQSIVPSVDELWAKLLKFSTELSGVRYDQNRFNTRRREIMVQLPEAVRDFLTAHHVSLLDLGYESETNKKALKKAFTSHLSKTLSTPIQPSLNGTRQALLN